MKTIVVYKSYSGFTKKYAEWIASELRVDIFRQEDVTYEIVKRYDQIIYGGSLHGAKVVGLSKIQRLLKNQRLFVFAVGASPYKEKVISDVKKHNSLEEVFYMRGGFDKNKLSFFYRLLMAIFVWFLKRKKYKTSDDRGMIEAYSKPFDATKKEYLGELLHRVTSLK